MAIAQEHVGINIDTPTTQLDIRPANPGQPSLLNLATTDNLYFTRLFSGFGPAPGASLSWAHGRDFVFGRVNPDGTGFDMNMILQYTGRVGIGTFDPIAKLDIQAPGDSSTLVRLGTDRPWFFRQYLTGPGTELALQSDINSKSFNILAPNGTRAGHFFVSEGFNRVLLVPDTSGEVGIGKILDPRAKLHVSTNSNLTEAQLELTEEGDDYSRLKFTSIPNPNTRWTIAAAADTLMTDSRMNFYYSGPEGVGDRMTIRGNGSIGIQKFSPEATLDIKGGRWNLEGGDIGDLRIGTGSHSLQVGVATGGGGAGISRIYSTTGLWLGTAGGVDLAINSSGNVGIGTTNPTEKLHVAGNIRVSDLAGTGDRNVIVDGNGKMKVGTFGSGDADWLESADQVLTDRQVYVDATSPPASSMTIEGRTSNFNNFAALAIYNSTQFQGGTFHRMLIDADNIDVFRGAGVQPISDDLHLQEVSSGNLQLVDGGGNVGIGISANSSKVRIEGPDNNGSVAALEIKSSGNSQRMLIDGNEIDSYNGGQLSLNSNSGLPVSIGTLDAAAGYKLNVAGKVIAEEVRVQLQANWPDYVFSEDYKLQDLNSLEKSIKQLGHLPGIPAATQVEEQGMEVGEMQRKMMEKIEELTLYVIELNKANIDLQQQVEQLISERK